MSKQTNWISDVALFLAGGLLAASVSRVRAPLHLPGEAPAEGLDLSEIRSAICKLERRVDEEASTSSVRFGAIETRLEEHSTKLAEIPGILQIVSAVEQTLTKAMAPLHDRLTGQEQAITALKLVLGRGDRLVDRVLELAKEAKEQTIPGS